MAATTTTPKPKRPAKPKATTRPAAKATQPAPRRSRARASRDEDDDKPLIDLYDQGARVRSVSEDAGHAVIEMPIATAKRCFPHGMLDMAGPDRVAAAVERELAAIAKRAPDLAESALAATAVALAFELADPYNSATSKSQCARALQSTLRELRELAPPEVEKDGISKLVGSRKERRSGR